MVARPNMWHVDRRGPMATPGWQSPMTGTFFYQAFLHEVFRLALEFFMLLKIHGVGCFVEDHWGVEILRMCCKQVGISSGAKFLNSSRRQFKWFFILLDTTGAHATCVSS